MPTESPGWRQIGHYRILEEIGRGGQGVVYRAKDLTLGREVAIKTLRRTALSLQELERFKREARIASRLDHPGICPIYEVGDHEGEPYLVMRYVRGTTLAEKLFELRNSPTSDFTFTDVSESPAATWDEPSTGRAPEEHVEEPVQARAIPSGDSLHLVLRLIEQVARALHEAHEADIIHRDVKPGNILVACDGQPVLLDFGVATMLRDDTPTVTKTGQTPGTPQYMSPEQTSGRQIELDRRTDIYSLGVTLYECLTLRLPFKDDTGVARQVMFAPIPDPRAANRAISKDLKTVIETALEKDRDRRYRTAADFADDLRRVREHEPIKARPVGPIVRFARWTQRNPAIAGSVMATFAILVTALGFTLKLLREAQTARDSLDRAVALYEPLADLKRVEDLESWSQRLWPPVPQNATSADGMEGWIAEAQDLLDREAGHRSSLENLESGAGSYASSERARRIKVLKDLIGRLGELPSALAAMHNRLAAARTIEARTIGAPAGRWQEIARDLAQDPRFASISPLKPQLGLFPIGKNAEGFFEFAVAESGRIVERTVESKRVPIDEDSAAILVLLPGGELQFDPDSGDEARSEEEKPAHVVVEVPPFFIGKHEVTQAQWERVMRDNPAIGRPGSVSGVPTTLLNPVENVSWIECSDFCRRLGTRLPTQDEWEYAARASKPFAWGECDRVECLEGRENLADLTHEEKLGWKVADHVNWHDDFAMHAPVGTFRPNGLGLCDMLGNVSEWCADWYSKPRLPSASARRSDLAAASAGDRRVARGACWSYGARQASCSWFNPYTPYVKQPNLGVRMARSVDR